MLCGLHGAAELLCSVACVGCRIHEFSCCLGAQTSCFSLVCCLQVIHQFYCRFTGLPLEKVEEETDRDNFVSPKTAIELGLIDGVI